MSDQGGAAAQPAVQTQPAVVTETVVTPAATPPEPPAQDSDLQRAERLALLEERVNPLLSLPDRIGSLETRFRSDLDGLRTMLQEDREERERARMEAQAAAAAAAEIAAETLEQSEEGERDQTNPDSGEIEEVVVEPTPPPQEQDENPPAPERKSKLRGWF